MLSVATDYQECFTSLCRPSIPVRLPLHITAEVQEALFVCTNRIFFSGLRVHSFCAKVLLPIGGMLLLTLGTEKACCMSELALIKC